MTNLTLETLNKMAGWIVNVSCEDTCQICAYYKDFPCVDDDIEPCPYKRTKGTMACRNGIIAHFMREVENER